ELRETTGLPVMLSPGVLNDAQLDLLAQAGVDWYACYQETHNQDLFTRLRPGQGYEKRLQARRQAAALGVRTEEGVLVGVGATLEDLADSVLHMMHEPLGQVRVMTYVPHEVTMPSAFPTTHEPYAQELQLIAIMRLYMPQRLIPASLDVDGLDGLQARLDAGANVVTSMIPSGYGFAGVVSEHLDIENHRRGTPAVRAVLEQQGLCAATPTGYRDWLLHHPPAFDTLAEVGVCG
ncbi:MAG: methylornithine synthase PylB, partial [Bilophila sp.]